MICRCISPTKLRDGTALETDPEPGPGADRGGRLRPHPARGDLGLTPKCGCINVHSSLLPKYRGAAPIHWAVLNGDKETGVTIMHMAHGPGRRGHHRPGRNTHRPRRDGGDCSTTVWPALGADLLVETVQDIAAGTATRTPQDETPSHAGPHAEPGAVRPWTGPSPPGALHDQVRGLHPLAAAATAELNGVQRCKVFATAVLDETTRKAAPGTCPGARIRRASKIACGEGTVLRIDDPASRRREADGRRRLPARGIPSPWIERPRERRETGHVRTRSRTADPRGYGSARRPGPTASLKK